MEGGIAITHGSTVHAQHRVGGLTFAALHTKSVVVVQAVLTPAAHVEASAQVVHGALPEAENVLPASHGKG